MKAPNLDPNDPAVRTAVFGKQVEEFLASDIGAYLVDQARFQLEQAELRLKSVDAFDGPAVLRAQLEVRLYEQFTGWLGHAIQDGLTAVRIIDGEEDSDA
jgi:hypothetical protein